MTTALYPQLRCDHCIGTTEHVDIGMAEIGSSKRQYRCSQCKRVQEHWPVRTMPDEVGATISNVIPLPVSATAPTLPAPPALFDLSAHAELLKMALATNGVDYQHRQCQEECGELIVAINHLARGKRGAEAVAQEWADVLLMLHLVALTLPEALLRKALEMQIGKLRAAMEGAGK